MTRTAPRLADGYVSVCAADGPWSPGSASLQRRQISSWTEHRGWRLSRVFEETGCRGLWGPRAALEQALTRIECRETGAIVVTRLHHVGHSLDRALDAIERIQAAGGTFVSVLDDVDLSTASGRHVLRVLLSVAKW